jgi:tetratricopeptide (TPR) repeat protein
MTVQEALALAWTNLQSGNRVMAAALLQQAIHADPYNPDVLCAAAPLAQALGDLDKATTLYRQALDLQPRRAETWLDLGNCLYFQERRLEAAEAYEQALRLKPDYVQAHTNLGTILQDEGRLDEAIERQERALRIDANFFDAVFNRANALKELGRHEEAVGAYEHALRLRPEFPGAHLNLGMEYLLLGRYERGWPHYEWRWQANQPAPRGFTLPLWDGTPLEHKTILLHSEQGFGDTILFVRYAGLVKRYGGRVILECPVRLVELLRSSDGPDEVIERGPILPEFDVQAPLLSLPCILRTTVRTIPADVPYLFANEALCRQWEPEIKKERTFRVGIAWQGDPTYRWDRQRSIPLASFAPLAAIDGVQLFSLQKGPGAEQVSEIAWQFPVVNLADRLDAASGAFLDTAAVMKNLHLVIAPDTAVAHLAGALGIPVWVPLGANPHWLWMLDREDSPWYPTLRLFRQQESGNWHGPFERMVLALRDLVASQRD